MGGGGEESGGGWDGSIIQILTNYKRICDRQNFLQKLSCNYTILYYCNYNSKNVIKTNSCNLIWPK